MSSKEEERAHCERMAVNKLERCALRISATGVYNDVEAGDIADLIARERAAARKEALEQCALMCGKAADIAAAVHSIQARDLADALSKDIRSLLEGE